MAHCRSAGIILSALAALHHPAWRAAHVRTLYRTTRAGGFALGIVATVALLASNRIAREAMAVTFTRPTHVSEVFCPSKISGHAFATFVAPCVVPAIDTFRFCHRSFFQLPTQLLYRHLVYRIRIGYGHVIVDADPSVSVAIFETWHALTVIRRIADVQW